MGMNSKKEEIWDPFVKLFSKILELRMNKFLSIEGALVLLKLGVEFNLFQIFNVKTQFQLERDNRFFAIYIMGPQMHKKSPYHKQVVTKIAHKIHTSIIWLVMAQYMIKPIVWAAKRTIDKCPSHIWYLMLDSEVSPTRRRIEDPLVTGKNKNAQHMFPM